MGTPKEDPQAKRDRERQRRTAEAESRSQGQRAAGSLATDLFSVYGRLPSVNMFNAGVGAPRPGTNGQGYNSMLGKNS